MFKMKCLSFILIVVSMNGVLGSIGPVGYELYRHMNGMSALRTGVHSKQFSSFDRKGGNGDGGPFACLRTDPFGHCVIGEHLGAGEIDSIWMTRDNGVFNKTGKLLVKLDDIIVLDHNLQDILNGQLGAPFVWPLVGNGDDTSGGGVIKVPMPFKRSMFVAVDQNPNYYHITYRTFGDSTHIETFDPSDTADDVIKQLRSFGLKDPKPAVSGVQNEHTVHTLNTTVTTIFERHNFSGEVRELRLQAPDLVRSPRTVDDGRAFGLNGWSEYIAAVDPTNTGVRITRRLDPGVGKEVATLIVDGTTAGVWDSTNITGQGVWAEQTVQISAQLTQNKTHINVRQVFVSSAVDFNEFRYEIDSLVRGQWVRTDVLEVGPNHPGDERAHHYQISGQTFAGQRVFRYEVEPKTLQTSDQFLATAHIRITFDGTVTVDAPLGQFFGTGLGMFDTRSLWFGVDARNRVFSAFWSMPFASSVAIDIISANVSDIHIVSDVTFVNDSNIKVLLESKQLSHFHATHNSYTTTPGNDYVFLNTSGWGTVYGVSHTMRGLIKSGNLRDYLEGDERIFIDGKLTPELYGTGTEDFYESGWYFRGGITFDMPLNGNSGYETTGDDCLYDCTQAIRLYSEGLSFESSIVLGIEHGPIDDNEPAIYSSVTYWYGSTHPLITQTDLIDLNDNPSRESHQYSTENEAKYELSSSYEGPKYKQISKSFATNTTKPITFKVSVHSDNAGVRIFRTSDQKVGRQCVDVYADNQLVGRWLQPLANQWSRFLDDSYDLPQSVCKGKTQLSIKLVPVSYEGSDTLWTAINYKIMSISS